MFVNIRLPSSMFARLNPGGYRTWGSSSESFHTSFQETQNTVMQTTMPKSMSTRERMDMPPFYWISRPGAGWRPLCAGPPMSWE